MGSLQVFPLDVTGVKYPFKDHRTIIGRPISATDSTKHQAFQAKFNPDIPQITSRFEFHVKTLYSQRNCITAMCLNVKSTKIRNLQRAENNCHYIKIHLRCQILSSGRTSCLITVHYCQVPYFLFISYSSLVHLRNWHHNSCPLRGLSRTYN